MMYPYAYMCIYMHIPMYVYTCASDPQAFQIQENPKNTSIDHLWEFEMGCFASDREAEEVNLDSMEQMIFKVSANQFAKRKHT